MMSAQPTLSVVDDDTDHRPASDRAAPENKPQRAERSVGIDASLVAPPKRKRSRKIWIAGLLLIVAAAGAGGTWWALGKTETTAVPTTVAVTRGDIEETVLASGTLEASSLVSVGAQVSGIVKSVDVALGDTVAVGDPIAEIDSLDQANAVKSASASLANMEAQRMAQVAAVAQAQKSLERADEMAGQQLISDADHEAAQANLTSAQAQLASLEAQIQQATINVETAELDLSRTKITAPTAGTVVAVLVQQGQTVSAQQSAPTLVKIANLDTMLIKAEISEADVTRVEAGQKVYFTILGDPDTRINATLRSVEPAPSSIASDSTTASATTAIYYNGIFEVPNPDHMLRISMTANVTIVLDDALDALTIPASALGPTGPDGQTMVRVYDPETGETRPTRIKVGLNNSISAEIESGLEAGDLVVTSTASAAGARPAGGQAAAGGLSALGGGGGRAGGGGRPPGL